MSTLNHILESTDELALSELVDRAAKVLDAVQANPSDDRVAARPDARTVRYYQSLGLVDKPLRYEGRRAVYGRRHLVQVVATKMLQSEGYSLAQVQPVIAAQPTEDLAGSILGAVGLESIRAGEIANHTHVADASGTSARNRWVTVELAPGVLVNIDPDRVSDVDTLIARLADATPHSGVTS